MDALAPFGIPLDPHTPVRLLSVAQRQLVEIAKALRSQARVLILDEPTAPLTPDEVAQLFTILAELKRRGTSIVFISHRLPEVLEIADRITVLKDGEVVGTVMGREASEDRLVQMMVGRQLEVVMPARAGGPGGAPRLEVESLSGDGYFRDVSFTVRAGEIVGLAGIEGNGQREIARSLFGLVPTSAGQVRVGGQPADLSSPRAAIASGVVYISNDRRRESLMVPLSVRENLALPNLARWERAGFVDERAEGAAVSQVIGSLAVRAASPEQAVGQLSGGNQQKVAIGRWLLARPQIFIFDEPTQGVDVGTKLSLYHLIRRLAQEGSGVLVLSSDLIELIGLCDRILVVSGGRIVREVPGREATEENIIGAAVTARREEKGATAARAATGYNPRAVWFQKWGSPLLLFGLLVVLMTLTALQSPYFLSPLNLSNLAIQTVPLAIAAFGQTAVILLGGVDLSGGPSMSLVTAVASTLIVGKTLPPTLPGIALALAIGMAVGLANAFLIRVVRIPDLLATLATFSIVQGLALLVRPSPGGNVSPAFMSLMTSKIGVVPIVPVLVLLAYLAGEVALQRSKLGAHLYATGSNEEAAYISGVPVGRIRVLAYVFCGLTAAMAGLFLAARIGSGDPQAGATFTLASITAVVVGGTSVFGGRGTFAGTYLGVLLIVGMQNFLSLLHVSAYYQYVWTGILTLLAVGLYSIQWVRARRRRAA